MKERDKKIIEKWSKTREKGKFNFMIRAGLSLWSNYRNINATTQTRRNDLLRTVS